jgi:hypothetical protein
VGSDEQIGMNLVRFRADRSQQSLADAMRERGWKWSQATVWSVETGERPLRLSEATDLAEVLGILLPLLLAHPEEARVHESMHQCRQAHAALELAATAYLEATAQLQVALALAQSAGVQLGDATREGGGWLETGLEQLVRDAQAAWEQNSRGSAKRRRTRKVQADG